MVRTLTADITTQKDAHTSKPYCIAKIEIGGTTGTKWVTAQQVDPGTCAACETSCESGCESACETASEPGDGRSWDHPWACVLEWGNIAVTQHEDNRYNVTGETYVVISDENGTWRDYYDDDEFQRKTVTIYQHFIDLAEGDLTVIYKGVINESPQWSDDNRRFTLRLTDYSKHFAKTIGFIADREKFPYIARDDDGAMLPIVFGKQKRSRCVAVNVGPTARLVRRCLWNSTKLYVDDAKDFPQNQAIQIRINNEIISGSFDGNTFTATERCVDVVTNYTVDSAVDAQSFDDVALSANDETYTGYYVKIQEANVDYGLDTYRRIIAYDGSRKRVHYQLPPFMHSVNGAYTIPNGHTYSITSRGFFLGWSHKAGADVYYVQSSYIYIVADHPCEEVEAIEGFGRYRLDEGDTSNYERTETEAYVQIRPELYTANTNDDQFSGTLGHNVTTVTFSRLPRELLPELTSNDIWADVKGVETDEDGSGTALENPSDIIKELLTRAQWGAGGATMYDAASFSVAQTACSYLKMAFTLSAPQELLDLLADLAWQGRCALNWDDGKAYLRVLSNEAHGLNATLTNDDFDVGSIRSEYTNLEQLVSEINAWYTDRDERKRVVVKDGDIENTFGRRVSEREFWAYRTRHDVINIATFWLNRLKHIYEIVRLRAWLNVLELQRNDSVTIDYTTLFLASQVATVTGIDHHPGGGELRMAPTIDLTLRLPHYAGCSLACEVNCETGGCETGCEFACEIGEVGCWRCETACELACEIAWTTTAGEFGQQGICGACETSCEADETGCEACETDCETACETSCETGVTCNDCSPSLPQTLYVTFANLDGDFAAHNGKHTLIWGGSLCFWEKEIAGAAYLTFTWWDAGNCWAVRLGAKAGWCYKQWVSPADSNLCDPWNATFSEDDCFDTDCDDSASCEDSAGATCVVSQS